MALRRLIENRVRRLLLVSEYQRVMRGCTAAGASSPRGCTAAEQQSRCAYMDM
eukprot:COSAG01_NODE_6667_length_3555_cov_33.351273_5_plen_53_part_00